MTLVASLPPLAAYAIGFQTLVYLALPRHLRFAWAPLVTGFMGAVVTAVAGVTFGFDTVGLGVTDPATIVAWGLAATFTTALVGWFMLNSTALRPTLADPRIGSLDRRQAAQQILIRIPIMTAFIEEAFFRGVLHAALMAFYTPEVALWAGAGMFGLWHIGPGIDQSQQNGHRKMMATAGTAVTVVATTLAGAGLVWLRMETGSIWASVAVHASLNMTMAWFSRVASRSNSVARMHAGP